MDYYSGSFAIQLSTPTLQEIAIRNEALSSRRGPSFLLQILFIILMKKVELYLLGALVVIDLQ